MTSRPVRRLRAAGLLLAALIAGFVFVAPTSAAPPKYFSATAAPSSIQPGATTNVVLTIENKANNRIEFDAVRVTKPAGISIAGAVTAVTTDGANLAQAAAANSPYLEFYDANVDRGEKVFITIPVAAPCSNAEYPWVVDVRQSNNFNGTDNKFDAFPGSTVPVTTVSGGCPTIEFGGQPAGAENGKLITAVAYVPTSTSKVTVRVVAGGSVVDVDGLSITLAGQVAATNAASASFVGLTATTVDGVATFGSLASLANIVDGTYELVASASGYGSVTSNAFVVQDVDCSTDTLPCTTGVLTSGSGNTAEVVVNDGDGLVGNLNGSFGASDIDCPYFVEVADQLDFGLENLNGLDLSNKTKTVTMIVADTRTELWEYQICFQAPYDFPAIVLAEDAVDGLASLWEAVSLGEFAAEPVGGGEFRGLLLPCNLGQGIPCIESRTDLGSTVKIIITTPAADPGLRF